MSIVSRQSGRTRTSGLFLLCFGSGNSRLGTFCASCKKRRKPGAPMTTPVRPWIRRMPRCGRPRSLSAMPRRRSGMSGTNCWSPLPAGGIKMRSWRSSRTSGWIFGGRLPLTASRQTGAPF